MDASGISRTPPATERETLIPTVEEVFRALLTEKLRSGVTTGNETAPQPQTQATRGSAAEAYSQTQSTSEGHRPALTVGALMRSPVITAGAGATIAQARALLSRNRFHHLPVIDASAQLVGMVTDHDLDRAADDSAPVSSVMSGDVQTTTPDASVRHAAFLMLDRRIASLPVIDEAANVVGILTITDILRAIASRAPLELWA